MPFALSLRTGTDIVTGGYVVALIVSSGTMDKVHRLNGAKCDTLTSESRRILKGVDLNKG
jgi:hypothetical protein